MLIQMQRRSYHEWKQSKSKLLTKQHMTSSMKSPAPQKYT